MAINQDRVFAGAHDGSTKVFDINSGQLLKDLKGHTMSVWGLAVMPSGDRYFSAGSDGTIKVWDWRNEDDAACLVKSIPDHNAKVYGLVVDQGRLYSASSDKTVKVWDTETLECLATFQGHTGGVNCLAALTEASAHQLVTGSSDKTIKLWDVTTGTCLKTVRRGTSEVLDVAVGDGMLFGSTYDAVIHVYDINETRELGTLSGHNWEVWQLEYGQGHLFSASFDHTIKRWDPRRFQCDLTLKGHKSKSLYVSSPVQWWPYLTFRCQGTNDGNLFVRSLLPQVSCMEWPWTKIIWSLVVQTVPSRYFQFPMSTSSMFVSLDRSMSN